MTTPTTPITPAAGNSLPDLANRIKSAHAAVIDATNNAVQRAIAAGVLLHEAKSKMEHGQWLPWLKTNCPDISDRTARRYVRLASSRAELEKTLREKSATMADLTIVGAEELLGPETRPDGTGESKNPSDAYDKAEEKLIKRLQDLPPEDAEAAANATIRQLKDTVATMMKVAAAAAKKAA